MMKIEATWQTSHTQKKKPKIKQNIIKSLSQTFLFAVGFFVMLSAEKEAIF